MLDDGPIAAVLNGPIDHFVEFLLVLAVIWCVACMVDRVACRPQRRSSQGQRPGAQGVDKHVR